MNNGIRLNNFEYGINNVLRSEISISKNEINVYEELFKLEFNIIFGNDAVKNLSKSIDNTIKAIPFKNIIDRINIVLKIKNNDTIKPYYMYDKNIFSNKDLNIEEQLSLQSTQFNSIMKNYLNIFSSLNSLSKIKRKLFMEIEIYVLDKNNKLFTLFEYIKLNLENTMKKNISELKAEASKQINRIITNFGGYSSNKIQRWLPIITPDKYMYDKDNLNKDIANIYVEIINDISQSQKKLFSYSFMLGGPNISNYSFNPSDNDNNFLKYILINKSLKDKFDFYSFYYDKTDDNVGFDVSDSQFNSMNYLNTLYNKEIYFTNQGIHIHPCQDINDDNKLKQNGYNELNNEFLLYKNNVYTFKNKLISWNEDISGLIYYNTDDNRCTYSHSFDLYRLINNIVLTYNNLISNEIIGDTKVSYNQITFYDDDKINKLFVLWTENENYNIILQSHYARKYYNLSKIDDIKYVNLLSNINVNFNNNFVIVEEQNVMSKSKLARFRSKIKRTFLHYKYTIEHLINVLPGSYNKEIIETNYYRLLRSIAFELGESKYTLDAVKNGSYLNALDKEADFLEEVSDDLLYNNFGALIDLPKKSKWTYDQYRRMITAVIEVLLKGPTKVNIQSAIKKFTQYDNRIYELYNENDLYMFDNVADLDLTYRFAVQIIKDINVYDDAEELMENLIYLLNIIKPAQALFLIYILFEENEIVEIVKNALDDLYVDSKIEFREPKFGIELTNTFELYNKNERNILVGEKDNSQYNKLAVPYYKLKDLLDAESNINIKEHYKSIEIKNNLFIESAMNYKDLYSVEYETDNSGNIKYDNLGNPILKNHNIKFDSAINLKDNYKGDIIFSKKFLTHKVTSYYNENIYFNNKEVTYVINNKENIKVFLNGALITYNNYDYILMGECACGIKFNNNIYKFKEDDIIDIIYIKVGNYIGDLNKLMDKLNSKSKINLFEDTDNITNNYWIKPLGFKLLGNLPKLSKENIHKLRTGKLNDTKNIILGKLQDQHNVILFINTDKRQNKFSNEELKYINDMKNNGIRVIIGNSKDEEMYLNNKNLI